MITITHGNLLDDDAAALVNPVNCDGVMPGGLARQVAARWPEILAPYAEDCRAGRIRMGQCTANATGDGRIIVQFPTMPHPGMAARLADIETGLKSLRALIEAAPDTYPSIAIPGLGCGVGGLDWDDVCALIEQALADLPTDIRLYQPGHH